MPSAHYFILKMYEEVLLLVRISFLARAFCWKIESGAQDHFLLHVSSDNLVSYTEFSIKQMIDLRNPNLYSSCCWR